MKKYTILYCFDADISIEVLADSEEEARAKAREVRIDKDDLDLEVNEETVLEAIDVPDLRILIEKAEDIIKEAEEDDIEFLLDSWPTVTTEIWTGENIEYSRQRMSLIYWDHDRNEIGFNTEESAADFGLSEIPEIEQLNICQSIIAQAESNGVLL